jgi:hypothetical protein
MKIRGGEKEMMASDEGDKETQIRKEKKKLEGTKK